MGISTRESPYLLWQMRSSTRREEGGSPGGVRSGNLESETYASTLRTVGAADEKGGCKLANPCRAKSGPRGHIQHGFFLCPTFALK